MSKIDNTYYVPTSIPAKIWGVPCGVQIRGVRSTERGKVRLISREIIFQIFQPI